MKKALTTLICCATLITLCGCQSSDNKNSESTNLVSDIEQIDSTSHFSGLDDTNLLYFMEDSIGADLESTLGTDYQIESVSATYISKEYIEEYAYNSKENIYFGYTLSEIEAQFDGKPFVFTLDNNGKTTVKAFEGYDDTFSKILHNVAIGTGVILLAVTVSALVPETAVSVVLAASAKSAMAVGTSSGVLSGAVEGIVKFVETGNIKESFKAAALTASEEFKWGALGGAVAGGVAKALTYPRANPNISSWRRSEEIAQWKYGGDTQVAFLNKKKVSVTTPNSTRPDILRTYHGHKEAIEVKNYSPQHYDSLIQSLKKEIPYRNEHLPEGTTQRLVLSTVGQNYTKAQIKQITTKLEKDLTTMCPACSHIPVDIIN